MIFTLQTSEESEPLFLNHIFSDGALLFSLMPAMHDIYFRAAPSAD